MKKFLTAMFTLFSTMMLVQAADTCSYQTKADLTEKAANIKVNSEINEEIIEEGDDETLPIIKYSIDLSILNVTKDFYVSVSNDNGYNDTLEYSDVKDGIIKFNYADINKITTFTFKVYATLDACNDNGSSYLVKTLRVTTPRYNEYSKREVCGDEAAEFYMCQKFVDFEDVSESKFLNRLEDYRKGKIDANGDKVEDKDSFFDKVMDFLDKNKWYILGGAIVIAGAGYGIYYYKTKKQRELGL